MKTILLLLIFTINAFASGPSEADKLKWFYQAFASYTCFHYKYNEMKDATHTWQRPFESYSNMWMLIYTDETGALIAQPSPHCDEERVKNCSSYWIRTVEFKDWWVPGGGIFLKCPASFDKIFMKNYVKKFYSKEIKLKND